MKPFLAAFPNEPPLLAFGLYYFPHRFTAPPGEFHRELAHDLENCNRLAATTPPECGKSTLLNLNASIYFVLEKGVKLVIIVSATGSTVGSTAVMWLDQITEELTTNEKLLADYPWLKERKSRRSTSHQTDLNWETKQKSGIKLPNNAQIWALGWAQLHRGPHPAFLLFDDPESDETVATEYQRQKWWSKFKKVGLRMLRMDDSVKGVWIGSYITKNCNLKKVIENDFPPEDRITFKNWIRRKYVAEIRGEDGEWDTFWPGSHWTKEALLAKRDEMGERDYKTEFMHDPPMSESNSAFNKNWIFHHKYSDLIDRNMSRARGRFWLCVDAASGTSKNADFRAWILGFQFKEPKDAFEKRPFIVDYGENRKPPDEVAAQLIGKMMEHYPNMPYVRGTKEGEGANWLEAEVRRQMKELKPPRTPNVTPLQMPGSRAGGKGKNWDECMAFVARHPFSIPEHKRERLEEVLFAMGSPGLDHDDLADAFMLFMRYIKVYPIGFEGRPRRSCLAHEYDTNPDDERYYPGHTYLEKETGMLITEY